MRDLLHGLVSSLAKAAAAIATDTTTNGLTIDLQGYTSCRFDIASATITDGAYVCTLQHGDLANASDMADVPAAQVLGAGVFAATDDNVIKSLSYLGSKRYVRVKIVSTGTTTGGVFGATALKARERHTGGQPV